MKSKAHLHGHPLHPMLIVFPIGLWIFSLIADIFYLAAGDSQWRVVALYTMAGGCLGALLAAVPGLIDYSTLGDSPAKKTATTHMIVNFVVLGIFAVNFLIRLQNNYEPGGLGFALSWIGIAGLSLSGWLGGDLVYVHKMGVIENKG